MGTITKITVSSMQWISFQMSWVAFANKRLDIFDISNLYKPYRRKWNIIKASVVMYCTFPDQKAFVVGSVESRYVICLIGRISENVCF